MILRQRAFWARYLQKHVDMTLKRTQTDIMATNQFEVDVSLSGIAFDWLRALTARTPIIKRA